jgi:hypothetical protein
MLHGLVGEHSGHGWIWRTFQPSGRNDGEKCLVRKRVAWISLAPHSVCRTQRKERSKLSAGNSSEREGNNSLVDVNCEEDWWCYSMLRDSVPGEITGLDPWECLGWGIWMIKRQVRTPSGRMMMFSPTVHGSEPSKWVWDNWCLLTPGSCSNSELVTWPSSLNAADSFIAGGPSFT